MDQIRQLIQNIVGTSLEARCRQGSAAGATSPKRAVARAAARAVGAGTLQPSARELGRVEEEGEAAAVVEARALRPPRSSCPASFATRGRRPGTTPPTPRPWSPAHLPLKLTQHCNPSQHPCTR